MSVDVFRRGVSLRASECPPIIIITIVPGEMGEEWIAVAKRLQGQFELRKLDAAVELLEGEVGRYLQPDEVDEVAKMGSSLALQKGPTGTLGGFVRLEKAGKPPILCGMTCHHLVVTEDSALCKLLLSTLAHPRISGPDVTLDEVQNGVRPAGWTARDVVVLSPSPMDLSDGIQHKLRYQRSCEAAVQETKEKIESGMANERRKQLLGRQIEDMENATAESRRLVEFKSHLGRVFASSGYRIADKGCALDWGLVEVDEDEGRAAGNLVSPRPTQLKLP